MRLILMFDLPVETNHQKGAYRKFIKFLDQDGFIRIQYSVYCKLCINKDSAITESKRINSNAPSEGEVRYLIITENQYQSIKCINNDYDLQEAITTTDRTLIIGGFNDED